MQGPQAAILGDGDRLHLQHGPIDLIIGADGNTSDSRQHAFEAAFDRFQSILDGLVKELTQHRRQMTCQSQMPNDPVARRMYRAAAPFCDRSFVTPMIAVAGSVADEVLASMIQAAPLTRAYVNNGGDIAVHLEDGAAYSVAMAQVAGLDLGRIQFTSENGIRGIATSGTKGRSHSLGIADSVTVLAKTAAQADAAATLIANAVDVPNNVEITRQPACELQPDSDLEDRLVVTSVPTLCVADRDAALKAGQHLAEKMLNADQIKGAALFLQNQNVTLGHGFGLPQKTVELINA